MTTNEALNVVLVHGGFVDGSGWEGVYKILKKDGYESASSRTRRYRWPTTWRRPSWLIGAQDGAVDSGRPFLRRRGDHRGRQRSEGRGARLYRRLRAGQGRVRVSLIKDPPPGAPVPPILPPQDGFLFLDKAKFPASFAADVDAEQGGVHGRLAGAVGRRARSAARSASRRGRRAELVPGGHRGQDDPAGRPALHVQAGGLDGGRGEGSHAIYVSQPDAVAELIATYLLLGVTVSSA